MAQQTTLLQRAVEANALLRGALTRALADPLVGMLILDCCKVTPFQGDVVTLGELDSVHELQLANKVC